MYVLSISNELAEDALVWNNFTNPPALPNSKPEPEESILIALPAVSVPPLSEILAALIEIDGASSLSFIVRTPVASSKVPFVL